jgi:hypothetical protein
VEPALIFALMCDTEAFGHTNFFKIRIVESLLRRSINDAFARIVLVPLLSEIVQNYSQSFVLMQFTHINNTKPHKLRYVYMTTSHLQQLY